MQTLNIIPAGRMMMLMMMVVKMMMMMMIRESLNSELQNLEPTRVMIFNCNHCRGLKIIYREIIY